MLLYSQRCTCPCTWSSIDLLRVCTDGAHVRCSQAQRPQDWMSSPMRPIQSLQLAQRIEAAGPEGLKLEDLKRVAEELGLDERQCIIHQRHLRHKARRQGRLPPAEGPWNPLGERSYRGCAQCFPVFLDEHSIGISKPLQVYLIMFTRRLVMQQPGCTHWLRKRCNINFTSLVYMPHRSTASDAHQAGAARHQQRASWAARQQRHGRAGCCRWRRLRPG